MERVNSYNPGTRTGPVPWTHTHTQAEWQMMKLLFWTRSTAASKSLWAMQTSRSSGSSCTQSTWSSSTPPSYTPAPARTPVDWQSTGGVLWVLTLLADVTDDLLPAQVTHLHSLLLRAVKYMRDFIPPVKKLDVGCWWWQVDWSFTLDWNNLHLETDSHIATLCALPTVFMIIWFICKFL